MEIVRWVIVYIGIAYLMAIGILAQGVIVLLMNVLVQEKRISSTVSDIGKLFHLAIMILFIAYTNGAIFLAVDKLEINAKFYSMISAFASIAFFVTALLVLRALNDVCKKKYTEPKEPA